MDQLWLFYSSVQVDYFGSESTSKVPLAKLATKNGFYNHCMTNVPAGSSAK